MTYLELLFDISNNDEEEVVFFTASLYGFGFDSFENKTNFLSAYILDAQFSLKSLQIEVLNQSNIELIEIRKLENKNWNEIWESSFNPVVIQNKCCIRASFHKKVSDIEFDILVTPKMSFGTGHHETTCLMIEEILLLDINAQKVLDVGCGTGVLSILANKKKASRIVAIDVDRNSFLNSLENIKANRCSEIDVFCQNIFQTNNKDFDLILANINKNVLLQEMQEYCSKLNYGGALILSGFFDSDFNCINTCAEKCGLKLNSRKEKNKWQCLVYKK